MNNDFAAEQVDTAPTIEVTVYRDGTVIDRVLCESEEDATAVIEQWTEHEGVRCEIDDLSVHHRAGQVLEPIEGALLDEDRPRPDSGGAPD